eukprot:TRINITY_DN7557_c0_g1_i1.p1 TRINITY_DN7557_c0_g1~~TRINITY_DN7557_c0_g1_i1.p1  ORF type:complete len:168 (-),score=29.91 TRINITY_DN7557_c0_g1_i1:627-1130(-)
MAAAVSEESVSEPAPAKAAAQLEEKTMEKPHDVHDVHAVTEAKPNSSRSTANEGCHHCSCGSASTAVAERGGSGSPHSANSSDDELLIASHNAELRHALKAAKESQMAASVAAACASSPVTRRLVRDASRKARQHLPSVSEETLDMAWEMMKISWKAAMFVRHQCSK